MTRINIVPVTDLTDQHLWAERREIFHVPYSLERMLKSKKGYDRNRVVSSYTLNTGHVYFFTDKGKFLGNRAEDLYQELIKRQFNISYRAYPKQIFLDNNLYNDYVPTPDEIKINVKRIEERIASKPNWYRKTNY